jgi:sodium transport system permease protein
MWTIFLKEILELRRDKRTWIFMLLVPTVLIPVLIAGFALLAHSKEEEAGKRVLKYAQFGMEHAPGLDQILRKTPLLERVALSAPGDIAAAVKDKRIDFALLVPADFESSVANGRAMPLDLHYSGTDAFDIIARRIRKLVSGYANEWRTRYLAERGFDGAAQHFVVEPVELKIANVANQRERIGELAGAFLPYIVLILALNAAMVAAIDLGVGEKERGTLESLLLLPLSRTRIVLGKFWAVTLVGCVASILCVTSIAVWGIGLIKGTGLTSLDELLNSIRWIDFVLLGLLLLPANAIIAALLLSLSFYARSQKEATGYSTQLMFILIIPILVALLPNMTLNSGWGWVPITNIALAVKEIIKGTLNLTDLAFVFFSNVMIAAALITFCVAWCRREAVLFRN